MTDNMSKIPDELQCLLGNGLCHIRPREQVWCVAVVLPKQLSINSECWVSVARMTCRFLHWTSGGTINHRLLSKTFRFCHAPVSSSMLSVGLRMTPGTRCFNARPMDRKKRRAIRPCPENPASTYLDSASSQSLRILNTASA